MRPATLIFAFVLLSVPSMAAAVSLSLPGLHGLGDVRHHEIEYADGEGRLHVLVGLPDGYDGSSTRRYPTLYLLDGGVLYPQLQGYYSYLLFGEEIPEMIIVGLSYGTDDWQQGNRRSTDYTAPTDEREFWGGAAAFQDVLREQVLPLVEKTYASDPARRLLFGQSLGGQFVLYSAQTDPGLFWGRIASNAALHRNLPLFLEMRPQAPTREVHLFVASASHDDSRFLEPRSKWIDTWTARDDKPWRLRVETLDGHGHFSAPPVAFRNGLRWIFGSGDQADSD